MTALATAIDGTAVGFTGVFVNDHTPELAHQFGTLVLPEHRGHRLGMGMKVENQKAVRAQHPECRVLTTGNAGTNAAMNAVNDRLGFRTVERCVEVQRQL